MAYAGRHSTDQEPKASGAAVDPVDAKARGLRGTWEVGN